MRPALGEDVEYLNSPALSVPAMAIERAAVDRALPLARVEPIQDLQTLVDRLQLQLLGNKADNRELTLLRAQLPGLGQVEVRMHPVGTGLQVDVHAAPASLRQLQVACADLLDRLQRLDPEQHVSLSLAANGGGGDQGSRNRRHVLDEWWPEP
ncbi:type III secretion system needle length determinant [Pseudomonas maumuensis]|uniref:Type III secretion system needle length determinant n=1 Tax=Pseudomonas maumuensis TaxID=2842354 RepID=A0ABX8NQX0_9PSED|nr:type III secretion system needle length determinant [Pseudomonas maumuensis]QXH58433.1 type III secretion system needle length determinant [Pseudomonas maumuensis]